MQNPITSRPVTQTFTYRNPEWPVSATVEHFSDEYRIAICGEVPVHLHEDVASWLWPIQQECWKNKRTIVTTSSGVILFTPLGDGAVDHQVVHGEVSPPLVMPLSDLGLSV
jgi:hypothetical protein